MHSENIVYENVSLRYSSGTLCDETLQFTLQTNIHSNGINNIFCYIFYDNEGLYASNYFWRHLRNTFYCEHAIHMATTNTTDTQILFKPNKTKKKYEENAKIYGLIRQILLVRLVILYVGVCM